ncbi:MAG: PepSY-associated TM helix domain-containing protein [Hyphomonadaceae bacterium]
MPEAKAGKPVWPKTSAALVRAVLAGHSALGLAFAALIFLVCFSGTVAVLRPEIERWESPQAKTATEATLGSVARMRDEALARYPGAHHLYVYLPTAETPYPRVLVDAVEGQPLKQWMADANGHLVSEQAAPFADFLQRLHFYLHLPPTWGLILVGLTGVALLSSLVSGVIAHPRVFRDAFHLRWGGSKRLQEADMHNRLGVWGLPFHVLVSLSGALLGLSTLMLGILAFVVFKGDVNKAYAMFIAPAPKDDPRPAPLAPLDPMFAHVSQQAPEAKITSVFFEHPGETGQSVTVTGETHNRLDRGDFWVFGGDGRMLEGGFSNSAESGNAILQGLYVLHFGTFGGWPIKIAYVLLGMGLTAVTASGVAIWLARRRDKGKPAPGWERVWTSFCWSQPPSFAIAALARLLAPAAPLTLVWGAATLAAVGLSAFWPPRVLSAVLRAASVVLIGLVPVVHVVLNGGSYGDSGAWVIDGIVVLLALACAASFVPLRARANPAPVPAPAE